MSNSERSEWVAILTRIFKSVKNKVIICVLIRLQASKPLGIYIPDTDHKKNFGR